MAKVDRRLRLQRGVEFVPEHVFQALAGASGSATVEGQLESSNIEREQLTAPSAPFEMSLSMSHLDAQFWASNTSRPYFQSFCLPPLQDDFSPTTAPNLKTFVPRPILREIEFSHDQRGESAALASRWHGKAIPTSSADDAFWTNPREGMPDYTRTGAYESMRIVVYEKRQTFFETTPATCSAEREVLSLEMNGTDFSARRLRQNPFLISGLAHEFDPFKTYVVALFAPNLVDASGSNAHIVLMAPQITLRFDFLLKTRDIDTSDTDRVQNIPEIHDGRKTGPALAITAATAGTTISADGAGGVNTALRTIDSVVRKKLVGGYRGFSETWPAEHLDHDSGYMVIPVPMFNGTAYNEAIARWTWGNMPGQPRTTDAVVDRALIPITQPLVIHHVYACVNFLSGHSAATEVNYANIRYGIAVAALTGIAGDEYEYQNIASVTFNPTLGTAAPHVIDSIRFGYTPALATWDQVLVSVPLVRDPANMGIGYYDNGGTRNRQGRPFFVGEGARHLGSANEGTDLRSLVGNNAAAVTQTTRGWEQYLEVRLSVAPQLSVFTNAAPPVWSANYGNGDIFMGYGGSFVYIIASRPVRE